MIWIISIHFQNWKNSENSEARETSLFISDSKVNNFYLRNMIEATHETFTTKNQTSDPSGHLRTTLHSINIAPH
jgi:hypothetical protein